MVDRTWFSDWRGAWGGLVRVAGLFAWVVNLRVDAARSRWMVHGREGLLVGSATSDDP